jgi:transposase
VDDGLGSSLGLRRLGCRCVSGHQEATSSLLDRLDTGCAWTCRGSAWRWPAGSAAVRWADRHPGSIRRPMARGLSDRATAAEEMGTHLAFGDAQTPSC